MIGSENAMQQKGIKNKRQKKSVVLILRNFAIVILLGYAIVVLISQQVTIFEKKKEIDNTQNKLLIAQQENEEYLSLLSMTDERAYMEKIAIEKLGFAYPGERRIFDKAKN